MLTAREALAAIKAALEAGPTDGPWWGDFASMMRNGSPQVVEYFVRRDGDDISIAAEIVNPESGLPSEANAAYIAAANPAALRAIIEHVERLEAALRQCHYALDRWLDCPEDATSYDNAMQRAILAEATARATVEATK